MWVVGGPVHEPAEGSCQQAGGGGPGGGGRRHAPPPPPRPPLKRVRPYVLPTHCFQSLDLLGKGQHLPATGLLLVCLHISW